jgi:hypothetical protein
MPPQRRPRTAFPFMLLAVGIGLSGYYGLQWSKLPQYSEADIAASTELNMQLELQARNARTDEAGLERLRQQTRKDLLADIQRQRNEVETGLGAGLIALVLAIGHLVLTTLLNRSRK